MQSLGGLLRSLSICDPLDKAGYCHHGTNFHLVLSLQHS
jgi:hypothetical protein